MTDSLALPVNRHLGARCVFTICTKSYIGLAETLGASLHDHGPTVDYYIVVVDHDISDVKSDIGTILPAKDFLGYGEKEWKQRTFKYDLVEFCTSIKARSFQRIFDLGYENAIYLDPDILVFDDMSQIFSALELHDVVVTPHRLDIHHDIPSRGGLFNLGFLAVRNSACARRMLQWWDDRLMHYSVSDAARGFFTDQKWMDNLPLVIPTQLLAVMDHPGMNLAPWNLHEREIKHDSGRAFVRLRTAPDDWRPLSFVHYSAFAYGELARGEFGAKAKAVCTRTSGFEPLVELLMERLQQSRFTEFQGISYQYATYSDGMPIHPGHRRIFAQIETKLEPSYDPFDANGDFYRALKARKMLVNSAHKGNYSSVGGGRQVRRVVKGLDLMSSLAIRTLGYDRYFLLSKFLTRYLHPANHVRLLDAENNARDVEYF